MFYTQSAVRGPQSAVRVLYWPIKLLNVTVYDYFSANFGQGAQAPAESLIRKYEGKSKNDLKKSLKVLKQSANADTTEIKYVSRLLRDILRDNTSCQVNADPMNHDYSISKNFWGCVKKIFNKKMKSSLRFPWMSVLITLQELFRQ